MEWKPPGDNVRSLVVITLAEAETLRRIMHRRQPQTDGVSLALHTLYGTCQANPWSLQTTPAHTPDATNGTRAAMEMLRYFNSDMHYTDEQVKMVRDGIYDTEYSKRRDFFAGCILRRRRMKRDPEGTPVEKIFTPPSEMAHLHAVNLISQFKKKLASRNEKQKDGDEWCGLSAREVYDQLRQGSAEGISQDQMVAGFKALGLDLSSTDVASLFTYVNADGDMHVSWDEFEDKFAIPTPKVIARRQWRCMSETCTQTEAGFDPVTTLPYQYDEDLKNCPVCGAGQVWNEPNDGADANRLQTVYIQGSGVFWCCLQGETCALQAAWGGFKNPMSARHCQLCGEARPGT